MKSNVRGGACILIRQIGILEKIFETFTCMKALDDFFNHVGMNAA